MENAVTGKAKLNQILMKNTNRGYKILLLEGLKAQLRDLAKSGDEICQKSWGKIDGSTFFTETKSIFGKQQDEEIVEKIISKQKSKFQMDQEIQTIQDDLYQIQKVVETKRNYNQQLERKIERITQQNNKVHKKARHSDLKRIKSNESLFKKIFG